MLYLRLLTLDKYVDKFILGFSNTSFTRRVKSPVSYAPFEKEISAFKDKIEFVYIDLENTKLSQSRYRNSSSWKREATARNYLIEGVKRQNPRPDDIILLCDVDEIPTRNAIQLIRQNPPEYYYNLQGEMYHYSFRWRVASWRRPLAIRYGAMNVPLDDYKFMPVITELPGVLHYHCSFCFPTIQGILRKLQSFSHVEYSRGKFRKAEYVFARIMCGYGTIPERWQMPEVLTPVEFDSTQIYIPDDPRFQYLKMRVGFEDIDTLKMDPETVMTYIPSNCSVVVRQENLTTYL